MNLCTNAWHAMQENGGILSVSLTDKNITGKDLPGLPGLKAGPHVCLSVADKGCGIPEDVMDRIFDPYFTTKDKNKGTGLGLSIVHGIVTGSGGCIQVSSQKGEGTKFEIFLPSIASENKESSEETVLPSGNNEMILFVDDEEFQTEMAEELIARLGYRVTAVNDSSQALNIFKADIRHFDLVITDMIMPKMTGKTLVREILATRPDMPVILCSGYSDEIDMDFLKEIGVAKYLMKPVDMKSLASAIQQALQK